MNLNEIEQYLKFLVIYFQLKVDISQKPQVLYWNLIQVLIIFNIYWVYKFLKTGNKGWLGGLSALWRHE